MRGVLSPWFPPKCTFPLVTLSPWLPAAYVPATRIRFADEDLALTNKTIDQIAVETEFPNLHYLSRMYARQVVCGSARYRARQRERKGCRIRTGSALSDCVTP